MTTLAAIAMFVAAVLPLAYMLVAATKRAGQLSERAGIGDVNLTNLTAKYSETVKERDELKWRLDEAAAMAVQFAANQPVDGAFAGMLAHLGVPPKAAAGDSNPAVLHQPAAPGNDPEGLLDPWGQPAPGLPRSRD